MKKKLPKLIRPVLIEGQDEPVQRPHAAAPAAPAAPADYLRLVPTPAPDKPAAPVVQPVLASAPEAAPSKPSPRREEALKLVERFAFWAGAAGAIPVPILDITGVGAVQVQMIRRLAEMYDADFSRSRIKALVAAVSGATLTGSSSLGAASLTKSVPILGPAVSSIAVPTLGASATFAIGVAFIEHFESGGTLLNFKLRKPNGVKKP
jgi:uncharacterized protein (DUF697 family)